MTEYDLKDRTKGFALQVLTFIAQIPDSMKGRLMARQLVRAATSVGTNYRAPCRARSKAEFIAKIGIVIEEADESAYWIELMLGDGLTSEDRTGGLLTEANELVAIMTQSRKTAQRET